MMTTTLTTIDVANGLVGGEPDWAPLLAALGPADDRELDEAMAPFMFMHFTDLANGVKLRAYKHRDTRRYVWLGPAAEDGAVTAYQVVPNGLDAGHAVEISLAAALDTVYRLV